LENKFLSRRAKGSVEHVSIVNKLLKILKSELGSEGWTLQVLKEMIKAVHPKMNDNVVLEKAGEQVEVT
jgi:hypothetical protein